MSPPHPQKKSHGQNLIWGVCGLCCGLELEDVVSTSACSFGRNVCTGAWGLITVQMAQIKTRVVRFEWDSVSWSKIAAGVRWLTTKSCAQVQQQSAFHCGPHVCMKPKTQNVNTLCKNKWLLTTNRKRTQPCWQFFCQMLNMDDNNRWKWDAVHARFR